MPNILKFLKENPNSRKIFGKGELKIIEKQLFGINLTQSEKNRLSRDIRAKLKFIKKLSKFEEEFELKKAKIVKDMVDDVKEVILEHKLRSRIKEIWLFGSTIENQRTFRSDVDIAVLFDEISKRDAFKFRVHVSGRVNDKIDIQVYNVLPKKIKNSILKNYKVLYKKSKNS